ncbi:two-component sensor histidine kinase [Sinimarinibacterium sp. CAU 1509]|uniref:ATP-binding protein n=1 Tax=Sinimarinibacterium sp. CAU 1509 TaxID=2562283 RepID=UPI0010ABBCE4|nr:ATP-binding protein [Sinimarinibacterium sp. CAU 1509]TJY64946.1 two-component sensor histidine kinase [Sinimarinibacterium sp. CAU 1509]
MRSIRGRLLLSLLGAAALIWAVTAVLAYRDALHEVDELLDAHLAQAATLLIAQSGELDELDTDHTSLLHKYSRRVAFQVWEHGTELRLHSLNAPDRRLSKSDDGFSDSRIDGVRWRVFSVWNDDLLIQVAEESRARSSIARGVGRNLILPIILGLPILGLLIAWSVRGSLRPLLQLSQDVGRRAPDHLEPIGTRDDMPTELRPLVDRLNTLLGQLSNSLESERRFTADAAHELRTPIAALKIQAQVVRDAIDDATRRHALDQVLLGCDRAARLIEQLLTLGRLQPSHLDSRANPVSLRTLAAGVVAEMAPAALQRQVELSLDAEDCVVDGYPALLAILLRNLIDNAVRYGADGAQVNVRVGVIDGAPQLQVIDHGPGVAAADRARLGQRFQRLGRADTGGTGLGLSIVRRIADLHRAELRFTSAESGGTGLCVSLRFTASSPGTQTTKNPGI